MNPFLLVIQFSFICIQSYTQNCQGSYSCASGSISCFYTEPCIIHCDGDSDISYGTCRDAQVEIQTATDLTLNCYKFSDCMDMTVYCGTGDCTINCGIDPGYSDYCRGMNIICSLGVCNINCNQIGVNTCTDVTINVTATASYSCTGVDCDGVTFIGETIPSAAVTTYIPTIAPTSILSISPTTLIPTKNPAIIQTIKSTSEVSTATRPTLVTLCVFQINIAGTDGNITITEVVGTVIDSINEEFAELFVVNTDYALDVDVIDNTIITVTLMATSITVLDKYEINTIKDATQNNLNAKYGNGIVLVELMVDEYSSSTTIFNTEHLQIMHDENVVSSLEKVMVGCIAMFCIVLLIVLLVLLIWKKHKKRQAKCSAVTVNSVECNIEMNIISSVDSDMDIMSTSIIKSLSEDDEKSEEMGTKKSVHTIANIAQQADDEEMYNNASTRGVTSGEVTPCGKETSGNNNTPGFYVESGEV